MQQSHNHHPIFCRLLILTGLLLVISHGIVPSQAATGKVIPRTILAVYSSNDTPDVKTTLIHMRAEMPLNHLGLKLRYWDLKQGLPSPETMRHVRGIITWFRPGVHLEKPVEYLQWATRQVRQGKRMVVFGNPAFAKAKDGTLTPLKYINALMAELGLRYTREWVNVTYNKQILDIDFDYLGFERPIAGTLSPYGVVQALNSDVKILLRVGKVEQPDTVSVLAALSPKGGYVAENYACYSHYDASREYEQRQWFVNPFRFFENAFATHDMPKPDTTTLAGRRIFYSHIDGDGWLNVSEIPKYRNTLGLSSEVIYDEVLTRFPGLPVTVAPIAADLDPQWVGGERSQQVARKIFALPNVEPASHTYSHPFYWSFFMAGDPEVERPYLDRYQFGSWAGNSIASKIKDAILPASHAGTTHAHYHPREGKALSQFPQLSKQYEIPRAYANKPYDLKREIGGAADYIRQFVPEGKSLRLVQWSGDTLPFEEALAETRRAKLLNINGGDSRFDSEYHSYAWVSPLGRQVGNEWQVYASNSNENTYTNDWTGRFYGFRYLLNTSVNTETPIRIKPLNVYYHMYSGEKEASLNALRNNLLHVQDSRMHPIMTSEYVETVLGFLNAELFETGADRWQVRSRGALQTIRFDDKEDYSVDFKRSSGVIGQKHFQGSLYVHLDKSRDVVDIALKKDSDTTGGAGTPYLAEANWQTWGVVHGKPGTQFSFTASGFGKGEWSWQMPGYGNYEIRVHENDAGKTVKTLDIATVDTYKVLSFTHPMRHNVPVTFEIVQTETPVIQ